MIKRLHFREKNRIMKKSLGGYGYSTIETGMELLSSMERGLLFSFPSDMVLFACGYFYLTVAVYSFYLLTYHTLFCRRNS